MRLRELVETSRAVGEVRGRLEKIARLAALLERLAPEEIEIGVSFLVFTSKICSSPFSS